MKRLLWELPVEGVRVSFILSPLAVVCRILISDSNIACKDSLYPWSFQGSDLSRAVWTKGQNRQGKPRACGMGIRTQYAVEVAIETMPVSLKTSQVRMLKTPNHAEFKCAKAPFSSLNSNNTLQKIILWLHLPKESLKDKSGWRGGSKVKSCSFQRTQVPSPAHQVGVYR